MVHVCDQNHSRGSFQLEELLPYTRSSIGLISCIPFLSCLASNDGDGHVDVLVFPMLKLLVWTAGLDKATAGIMDMDQCCLLNQWIDPVYFALMYVVYNTSATRHYTHWYGIRRTFQLSSTKLRKANINILLYTQARLMFAAAAAVALIHSTHVIRCVVFLLRIEVKIEVHDICLFR